MFFSLVDEFSCVIKIKQSIGEEVNKENFEMLFNAVSKVLNLKECFGQAEKKSGSVGYTDVYAFSNKIRLSYNPKRVDMGLYIWVSATGLQDLQINRQLDFWQIYERLDDLVATIDFADSWHYSRLDYVADFIDENQAVNELYQSIKSGHINFYTRVMTKKGEIKLRDTKSKVSAIENEGIANTIYIGSRKSGTNFLMRIYNKKEEQLQSATPYHIEQAKNCENWVRYEFSFRSDYAKSIKPLFDQCANQEVALRELARKALDRITFYEVDYDAIMHLLNQGADESEIDIEEFVNMTKACSIIDDYANSNDELFKLPSKQVNELYDTYKWHINNDSGLISFLYKVHKIYGYQAIIDFFKQAEITYLKEESKPSDEAIGYVDDALRRNLDKTKCPWTLSPDEHLWLLRHRYKGINNKDN